MPDQIDELLAREDRHDGPGGEEGAGLTFALHFVREIGLGTLLGILGGMAIRVIIDRTDLDSGLYPILFLALGLAVFGITSMAQGSGFLAVYIAGLIAGNSKMRHALGLRRFTHALTWLSQIAMFLTLGLLATPSEFPAVLVESIALAAFFAFFHGFAHGNEIPDSASFVSFGVGFLAATFLLHGLGWLLARLIPLAAALLFGASAAAQSP